MLGNPEAKAVRLLGRLPVMPRNGAPPRLKRLPASSRKMRLLPVFAQKKPILLPDPLPEMIVPEKKTQAIVPGVIPPVAGFSAKTMEQLRTEVLEPFREFPDIMQGQEKGNRAQQSGLGNLEISRELPAKGEIRLEENLAYRGHIEAMVHKRMVRKAAIFQPGNLSPVPTDSIKI